MTPANIAGMAMLNGLNIVALTDHNSCGNCETFLKVAKANGLIGVAGMELTTAEDIHVVCLFPELDDAMRFDSFVDTKRMKIKNKPEIFAKADKFLLLEDYIIYRLTGNFYASRSLYSSSLLMVIILSQ